MGPKRTKNVSCWMESTISKSSKHIINSPIVNQFKNEKTSTQTPKTSTSIYDNSCFLLYCLTHQRILLSSFKGNRFLPFVQLSPKQSWRSTSIDAVLHLIIRINNSLAADKTLFKYYRSNLPFQSFKLIHLFRYQLPQTRRFIIRVIYAIEIDSTKIKCCEQSNDTQYGWYNLNEVANGRVVNLCGPEVSFFASRIISQNQIVIPKLVEYGLNSILRYVSDYEQINGNLDQDWNENSQELSALLINLTANDIERLYEDFIEHCFPSFFLTRQSFTMFMKQRQIESDTKILSRYFTIFCIKSKQFLHFNELLFGLASIDHRTPHAKARMLFIFNYYDYDCDSRLNFEEFRRLMFDLFQRKPSNQTVKEMMRKLISCDVQSTFDQNEECKLFVTFEQFRYAIVNHIFRGTSRLCRTKVSPFGQVTRYLSVRKLNKIINDRTKLISVFVNRRYEGKCGSCVSNKPYQISNNVTYLKSNGQWLHSKRLKSSLNVNTYSNEVTFNHKSALHCLLQQIRDFNQTKKVNFGNNKCGLFSKEPEAYLVQFIDDIKKIAVDVGKLVESEDRVLNLCDPTTIIGDIHGNLEDLLTMERTLWPRVPLLTGNYLFLGDFVDRGRWGFESFLYLMILKLLCPTKIYLLRGNHEIRSIQMKYSFYDELISKYGCTHGKTLFDSYNDVFDRLPFAAIVGRSIFAGHGGIPRSCINLNTLNTIAPRILPNPQQTSVAVWEILWSDPIEFAHFEEIALTSGTRISLQDSTYMFMNNIKRGTGYLFNEYAAFEFLRHNQLHFIVRAHEVPAEGFRFNFGTMCLTIFSCSHYCGNQNKCAVLLVDRDGRLRVIRIDTDMNGSPMNVLV
ncbi:hypothetical protein RDWZM_004947 [Blomia tropicalis]|uniref:Serine/threonine-protein phosphatase n=1 Tax=Blomia tropicalis TaxID=40697 RepID=A0A9Q0M4U6_BLOTA|nr:hypothetical protein RDWZM_004947 [Blomia tropicalis]